MSQDQYNDILQQAYAEGQKRHPGVHPGYHAAFANSVAYAMTGTAGGYGGPTMREHLAARQVPADGGLSFEEAIQKVEHICYGPITEAHARMMLEESCFDDPPEDLEAAQQLALQ